MWLRLELLKYVYLGFAQLIFLIQYKMWSLQKLLDVIYKDFYM